MNKDQTDSIDIDNVTKNIISNKCCFCELSKNPERNVSWFSQTYEAAQLFST